VVKIDTNPSSRASGTEPTRGLLPGAGGPGGGSGGSNSGCSGGRRTAERSEVLQLFAGLEANGAAGSDGDLDAGLRVASDALLAVADLEDAEAA